MKLFLNRTSPVSLQDQLAAQIGQLVAAGDLARGSRLPSIRALAARLRVHHNTVRAAYMRLEALGVIASQQGSGSRVVDHDEALARTPAGSTLHDLAARFVARARESGHGDAHIREALERVLTEPLVERVVVINPHPDLLRIYLHELGGVVSIPVEGMTFEELAASPGVWRRRSLFLTSSNHAANLRTELGEAGAMLVMQLASIQPLMEWAGSIPADGLLGLTSASDRFRILFRGMLSGLIDDDRLLDVSLEDPDLARSRLGLTTHVLMDAASATRVSPPGHARVFVFPLLGDDFKAELDRRLTRDERTGMAGPLGGNM